MAKTKKLTLAQRREDDLLRRACLHAESDIEGWLDALRHATDAATVELREEQTAFLKRLKKYRRKRWGLSKVEISLGKIHKCSLMRLLRNTFKRPKRP